MSACTTQPSTAPVVIVNLVALATIESSNNPKAINHKTGALGLCQIMPSTWKQFAKPKEQWNNAIDNSAVAERYLQWIGKTLKMWGCRQWDQSEYQLAAYNWGIGNFRKVNFDLTRVPRETKDYIRKYHDAEEKINKSPPKTKGKNATTNKSNSQS